MFTQFVMFMVTVQLSMMFESNFLVELAWRSGSVMDCHATTRGSIHGGNGVFTELHVLRKGQEKKGVSSLNDLAVDGMLNSTKKLIIKILFFFC